ncbi:MAG: prephenate dehydrogenase/arogenate dehydrogenase family protein, partial [Candidatus Bathyarchaeia archaeon]
MTETISVIGAGMIGGAIVKSLLKSGYAGKILATDSQPERIRAMEELGVSALRDNRKAAAEADIVFVCVKPGDVEKVLREISKEITGKLVISTAATVPLKFYKQ